MSLQDALLYLTSTNENPLALLHRLYPETITVRVNPSMGEIMTECLALNTGELQAATIRALAIREYSRTYNEFAALQRALNQAASSAQSIRSMATNPKFAAPDSAERIARVDALCATAKDAIDVAVRESGLESAEALEKHLFERLRDARDSF